MQCNRYLKSPIASGWSHSPNGLSRPRRSYRCCEKPCQRSNPSLIGQCLPDNGDTSWEFGGEEEMSAELLNEGLAEALSHYNQATKLSRLAVQAEMELAFASEDMAASTPADAASPEAMLSFWIEHGLSHAGAARLMDELRERGRMYTTAQLGAKVQRWQRVLPEVDIGGLASRDPHLLDADVNTAFLNIIVLVEAFPGQDVMSLLVKQPRLLWTEELRTRVRGVFKQLTSLHPSKDIEVVRAWALLPQHPCKSL